jgi:hypothetical protein
MEIVSIAGLAVSAFGLVNDLASTYRDLSKWNEEDIEVDNEWLELAIKNNIIASSQESYTWSSLKHVPTRELNGTHQVVIAINKDKKLKYRIVRGPANDRLVLMKKSS